MASAGMSSSAVATGARAPKSAGIGKRNGPFFPERSHNRPAQGREVPDGSERQRQVAPEGPDIGTLSALDHEICVVSVGAADEVQPLDEHLARFQFD